MRSHRRTAHRGSQLPPGLHVRWLPRVGRLRIRLVNGEVVRQTVDVVKLRFTMGGHDLVYPDIVPRGEIWLDVNMSLRDRAATLAHELHERELMARGLTYVKAHTSATALESRLRQRRRAS